MGIGTTIALMGAMKTNTDQELEAVKNAIQELGLTVENGKLCITVVDDTEEEEE